MDLFAAPYGFYMFALCTSVDDEVLEWLSTYQMNLDSVTGPYAAFGLFYNEIALTALTPADLYLPAVQGKYEAVLPDDILREGSKKIEDALRFHPVNKLDMEILVRSMTYASDAIARELGVLDRLPCLILCDDPHTSQFYLLPLDRANSSTLQDIRTLLSSAITKPENRIFLEAVKGWHALHGEYQNAVGRRELLSARKIADETSFSYAQARSVLDEAEQELRLGNAKKFRVCINRIWSNKKPPLGWVELKRQSNRISAMHSCARKLSRAAEASEIDGREKPDPAMSTAHGLLRTVGEQSNAGPAWCSDQLTTRAREEANALMARLRARFDYLIDDPEDFELIRLKRVCEDLAGLLHAERVSIGGMARPSLSDELDKLMREKRLTSNVERLRSATATALGQAPALLDVVCKAADLASGGST